MLTKTQSVKTSLHKALLHFNVNNGPCRRSSYTVWDPVVRPYNAKWLFSIFYTLLFPLTLAVAVFARFNHRNCFLDSTCLLFLASPSCFHLLLPGTFSSCKWQSLWPSWFATFAICHRIDPQVNFVVGSRNFVCNIYQLVSRWFTCYCLLDTFGAPCSLLTF